MAKFINRQEEVIQIELTPHGKQKFSQGTFKPQYYAFFDDDILYDQDYRATGSQAARPAVANLDIVNNTATTYDAKTLIIKDTANTSVTYTFANSTFSAASVPTIGVASNTAAQIAANIKTSIEHANGHNGTIVASVIHGPEGVSTRVRLVQATAGADGDRAIAGTIPATMILTGSDAVATSFTGGKDATATAPVLISSEEKQNDIVSRIKEVPRLEIYSDRGLGKNYRNFEASGEPSAEQRVALGISNQAIASTIKTTNIANPTPNHATPVASKFLKPLGSNNPLQEYAPSWKIKAMGDSEPLSVSGTEEFPYRTGASGSEVIIPFFSSSLPLEYDISTITINLDADGRVIAKGGRESDERLWDLTKDGRLLLDVREINTFFKGNGNFDVEVFRETRSGNQVDFEQLAFINNQYEDASKMRLQEDPDLYSRVLAGDDELIGKKIPKLNPSYVEYFLSVRADDEIEDLDAQPEAGDSLYKTATSSDPVDPCEEP